MSSSRVMPVAHVEAVLLTHHPQEQRIAIAAEAFMNHAGVASEALYPLTLCRSPSIMLGHAVVEYPESWDAGLAIRSVRVGPLHG